MYPHDLNNRAWPTAGRATTERGWAQIRPAQWGQMGLSFSVGCAYRQRHRLLPRAAQTRGVPQVPGHHRPSSAETSCGASHSGQLRHSQACRGQGLADQAPPLHAALHPDLIVLAEPGRTLVSRTHRQSELAAEVRAIVALIPPGAVTTYGKIARALGVTPRQVGRAMSMLDDAVPWHRVVKADGTPAGCHNGRACELLRAELTPMVGGRIDLREARWDPHSGSGSDATKG